MIMSCFDRNRSGCERLKKFAFWITLGITPLFLGWSVQAQAPNDLFANAQVLSTPSGSVNGSNASCTKEVGEPNHVSAGGRSVWYQWTAPASGSVTFDTIGSTFDTMMAAYTGSTVSGLTKITSNDDINYSGGNLQSRISFNATAGTIYRIAVDGYGGASGSITFNWSQAAAAPPHNNLANARVISGSSGQDAASNAGATKEAGEPNHAGNTGGASVWYQWTAPSSNPVTFDTFGSSFDTLLAVYTGSSVSALTLVAQNNNDGASPQSRVAFTPVSGTAYRVAVDGNNGLSGNFILNWAQVSSGPANDHFANATLLNGNSGQVVSSSVNATKESGEPNHVSAGGSSVWYQWTAPANGSVSFDTIGSTFDTMMAVYIGSAVSSLTKITSNDDINYSGGNLQSRVSFNATAGTLYRIAVDGYRAASGTVTFNWNQAAAAPSHNNLANGRVITGTSGLDAANNVGATKEAGEPNHAGNAGGASVWYQWTAPTSGNVTFSTEGSSFNTLLALYTGNSYSDLVLRYSNDDIGAGNAQSAVTFEAVIDVTYLIAVDGFNGASGNIVLQWSLTGIGPAHDNFTAATLLQSSAGATYAATAWATKETGEPNHAGNAGGASVWYQWTAPSANPATFDTVGSTFDTLLAVYTGSSLSALTVVAENNNDGAPPQSRVAFTPVPGTTYRIAVDGNNGAVGNLALNWSQSGTGPANDHFANALVISNGNGQATASSINATKEAGEPDHAGANSGASIWFVWTAPATEVTYFETLGSNFDTVLAVYTGSSLAGLTAIASNNDISGDYRQSRVQFNAVAGTVYHIAVDGVSATSGSVKLQWNSGALLPDLIVWPNTVNPVVSNETFSVTHCAVEEGLITAGTHRLLRFSTETRNKGTADLVLGSPAGNPLFEYATCHSHYHLAGFMSYRLLDLNGQVVSTGFKTGFCLLDSNRWDPNASSSSKYDCSNQGIQKGWGDVYLSRLDGQWIVIDGVPDGLYYLEMTVNPYGVLQETDYSNNTSLIAVTIGTPPNDNFASAQVLDPNFGAISSANVNASAEAGEPSHARVTPRRTVWFKWRPANNQSVNIDTMGSAFDTILAVYTGTSVSQLTPVASNDDISFPSTLQSRVSFTAASGVDYMIVVDGYNGASGAIKLNRTTGGAAPQSLAANLNPPGRGNQPLIDEIPINDYVRLARGELKLGARGRPNRPVWIEVSSDLVNWEPLTTTLASPSGEAIFVDKSNFEIFRATPPKGTPAPPAQDHDHGNGNNVGQGQGHGHEGDYYPPLFFRIVVPDKWR